MVVVSTQCYQYIKRLASLKAFEAHYVSGNNDKIYMSEIRNMTDSNFTLKMVFYFSKAKNIKTKEEKKKNAENALAPDHYGNILVFFSFLQLSTLRFSNHVRLYMVVRSPLKSPPTKNRRQDFFSRSLSILVMYVYTILT